MNDAYPYPRDMNAIKCYRIFVANEDVLHCESVAGKYNVKIEFGGPPKRVNVFPGFERNGTTTQWSVAYITGNWVSITNVVGEWEKYLHDTTPDHLRDCFNPGMKIAPIGLRG